MGGPMRLGQGGMFGKGKKKVKKMPPPSSWPRVGYVQVHPDDGMVALYPREIFDENPSTFDPPPGPVATWGLTCTTNDDDGMGGIQQYMNMTNLSNNTTMLYSEYESPLEQWISNRLARKFSGGVQQQQHVTTTDDARTFVVKISLALNEGDVWRRIEVPASTRLSVFHDQILIPVCGFARGYHGYVFVDPSDGSTFGPDTNVAAYIDMMHASMQSSKSVFSSFFSFFPSQLNPLIQLKYPERTHRES